MRKAISWMFLMSILFVSCSVNNNYEEADKTAKITLNINYDLTVDENSSQSKTLDGAGNEPVSASDFYFYIVESGATDLSTAMVFEPNQELTEHAFIVGQQYDIYATTSPYDLSKSTPTPIVQFPTQDTAGELYEGMLTTQPLVSGTNTVSINVSLKVFQVSTDVNEAFIAIADQYDMLNVSISQGGEPLNLYYPDSFGEGMKPSFFLPSDEHDVAIYLIGKSNDMVTRDTLKTAIINKEDAIEGKHFTIRITDPIINLNPDIVFDNDWEDVEIPL